MDIIAIVNSASTDGYDVLIEYAEEAFSQPFGWHAHPEEVLRRALGLAGHGDSIENWTNDISDAEFQELLDGARARIAARRAGIETRKDTTMDVIAIVNAPSTASYNVQIEYADGSLSQPFGWYAHPAEALRRALRIAVPGDQIENWTNDISVEEFQELLNGLRARRAVRRAGNEVDVIAVVNALSIDGYDVEIRYADGASSQPLGWYGNPDEALCRAVRIAGHGDSIENWTSDISVEEFQELLDGVRARLAPLDH